MYSDEQIEAAAETYLAERLGELGLPFWAFLFHMPRAQPRGWLPSTGGRKEGRSNQRAAIASRPAAGHRPRS